MPELVNSSAQGYGSRQHRIVIATITLLTWLPPGAASHFNRQFLGAVQGTALTKSIPKGSLTASHFEG